MIDVAGTAAAFLALIEDTAAAVTPTPVTLPGRRYVAAGAAGAEPWDCEQVTVALVQLGGNLAVQQSDGAGSSGSASGVPLPSLTLTAEIVRAHPVIGDDGTLPTAAALGVAGAAAMRDAALLHAVRARVMGSAALTGGVGGDVRLGPVLPAGPEGGYAGTRLTVAVTLW